MTKTQRLMSWTLTACLVLFAVLAIYFGFQAQWLHVTVHGALMIATSSAITNVNQLRTNQILSKRIDLQQDQIHRLHYEVMFLRVDIESK